MYLEEGANVSQTADTYPMMMCTEERYTMRIFMCVNYGVISMEGIAYLEEFCNYTPLDFLAI